MLDNILLEKVLEHIENYADGREIVMFGRHLELQEGLENSGCKVEKIFTRNKEFLADETAHCTDARQMDGNKDKYYVIIPFYLANKGADQKQLLKKFGYTEKTDYVFYPNEDLTVTNLNGRVFDDYGNVVEGKCKNVSVKISGLENRVIIKDEVRVKGSLNISVSGSRHKVVIGEKCVFNGTNRIVIYQDAGNSDTSIEIGDSCAFTDNSIECRAHSEIKIGELSTFGFQTKIYAHSNSKLTIGTDCMFSFEVVVQTGDGHSIFDIETGRNISIAPIPIDDVFLHEVEIKDHIWVGRGAFILGGAGKTFIDEGSVIGAKSFVKGVFPNNCSIAGMPARVVRKNIAWSRSNQADSISVCKGYTRLTEDTPDNNPFSISKRIEKLEQEVERLSALLKEK